MRVEEVCMFLSDAELNEFRVDVAMMLPGTAIISAGTVTVDGSGFPVETYAPVAGGTVACRIDPLKSRGDRLREQIGRETLTEMYQLTVPWDAPIADVNLRVESAGRTYEVVQLDTFHSWNVSRRAIVSIVL